MDANLNLYVKTLDKLHKETNITLKGSGLGKAIIETTEGDSYYLTLDDSSGTHIIQKINRYKEESNIIPDEIPEGISYQSIETIKSYIKIGDIIEGTEINSNNLIKGEVIKINKLSNLIQVREKIYSNSFKIRNVDMDSIMILKTNNSKIYKTKEEI
jgi:hypothetical protein